MQQKSGNNRLEKIDNCFKMNIPELKIKNVVENFEIEGWGVKKTEREGLKSGEMEQVVH